MLGIHLADVLSVPLAVDPFDFYFSEKPEDIRKHQRRALGLWIVAALFVLAAILVLSMVFGFHFDVVWRYEIVGLFGASVGTAELLSRYRDAPSYVLLSPPGIGYVVINALASVAALGVILTFGWDFGAQGDAAAAMQVLVAGFGAMALFRSSLLTIKVGNNDVGIGPSSVLSIILAASDRSADRLRAADRASHVRQIMGNVSFEKSHESLLEVAVALMQNLNPADVAALRSSVETLNNKSALPDCAKSLLLGLKITDLVSTQVLDGAKASLGEIILAKPTVKPMSSPAHAQAQETDVSPELTRSGGGNGFASEGLPQTPQTPEPEQ